MKRKLLIALLLCTTVSGLSAQKPAKTDSLIFTEFYSSVLHEKRRIVVHLPLNYPKETSKKYPVMYVLDGGGLDFDMADRLFVFSSAGVVPECITVGILNAKDTRDRDQTPPFMQTDVNDPSSPMGKADQFFTFIQTELIPLIDSSYRVSGYQTISGHSRAGLFVLYSLLAHPDLFDARFCYSAPAWRFDNILIKRLADNLLAKQRFKKKSFLFFSVGENENPNIRSAYTGLTGMLQKIKPNHLKWSGYITPLADHQTNPVFSSAKGIMEWGRFWKGAGGLD